MVTLNKLKKKFPEHYLVNRFLSQLNDSWTGGKFYLGGQIPLGPDDEITNEIICKVLEIQSQPCEITNSWEQASVERSKRDMIEFMTLYNDYYRCVKYNGILRSIVFWISPARKRAAEKVFHPSNLDFSSEHDVPQIKK